MAEINENEVLYMLTIPRFNMPDFGSLDEDYLCREDQLTWYVSEDDLEKSGERCRSGLRVCGRRI